MATHVQNTLESAGYLYNPFTQADIWGAPTMLNLAAITSQELQVGADDSALPQLANPGFGRPDYVAGSSVLPDEPVFARNRYAPVLAGGAEPQYGGGALAQKEHPAEPLVTKKQVESDTHFYSLLAFGAIIAAALYYQRS